MDTEAFSRAFSRWSPVSGMGTASSWHVTLPVTNPSGTGEGLGKEELSGFFVAVVKTGNLYYPGVLTLQVTLLFPAPVWLQLEALLTSCQ